MNNSHNNEDYHTVKVNGMYVIAYRLACRLNRNISEINHINAMELCNDEEQAFKIKDIEVAELIAKSINGLVLRHEIEYVKTSRST